MTKLLRVTALLAALLWLAATPAAAGDAMKPSVEGPIVGINLDPAAIAARCPAGYHAIVQSAGSGELTSEACTGPVEDSTEHCSRLLVVTEHQLAVIQIDAGPVTLVTPGVR